MIRNGKTPPDPEVATPAVVTPPREESFAGVRDETAPPFVETMPEVPFFPATVVGSAPDAVPPADWAGAPLGAAEPLTEEPTVWVEALVTRPLRFAGGKLWPARAGGRPFLQPESVARGQAAQGLVRFVEAPPA